MTYLITILQFALVIFLAWACRRDGFKRGYDQALKDQEKFAKECYQRGRSDESSWWIAAEMDVRAEVKEMRRHNG